MTTRLTTLFDRRSRTPVPATLRFGLGAEEILAVEAVWGPWRTSAVERLVESGFPEEAMPQHWHWDWAHKVPKLGLLAYQAVGVECDGAMQGLMLIATADHAARLAPDVGRPVVYVDYLESAPWNVRPLAEEPRYGAVGARLLAAAVRVSVAEGFDGRVGLHSLAQAEAFYEAACGMTRVGVDPDYESLIYFEFTRAQAAAFVEKEDDT